MPMTYEQHLDEVATLLYERYEQSEKAAIKLEIGRASCRERV